MKVAVEKQLVQAVINYLKGQKWVETNDFIVALLRSEDIKPEETDDKD